MKLSEIAALVQEVKMVKEADVNMLGMATTLYHGESVLSFLGDAKFLNALLENKDIKAIIVSQDIYDVTEFPKELGILIADNPKHKFYEIHNALTETDFYFKKFENQISPKAQISPFACIGDHSIVIGDDCIIEPQVVIHPGCIIKEKVIIRSGSQIGTNAFQFLNTGDKVITVKTAGRTVIENNVEIQHNCCVDRGAFGGDTILKEYVKLDNFVHIAHDDVIGERTLITAGVNLSGRVTIGKDSWIGVNATIANGLTIGENVTISLGSVVTRNVESNKTVTGNFAIDHARFIEFIKSIR